MSIQPEEILDAVVSHAQRLRVCERVLTKEPTNAPGSGCTASIVGRKLEPVGMASGMASSTARFEVWTRLYVDASNSKADAVITGVAWKLFAAWQADLDLELDYVWSIDIMGRYGEKLIGQFGYVELGGTFYRVMDIVLPIIINDAWPQGYSNA